MRDERWLIFYTQALTYSFQDWICWPLSTLWGCHCPSPKTGSTGTTESFWRELVGRSPQKIPAPEGTSPCSWFYCTNSGASWASSRHHWWLSCPWLACRCPLRCRSWPHRNHPGLLSRLAGQLCQRCYPAGAHETPQLDWNAGTRGSDWGIWAGSPRQA